MHFTVLSLLQVREQVPERATNVDTIGIIGDIDVDKVQALEAGRIIARDSIQYMAYTFMVLT